MNYLPLRHSVCINKSTKKIQKAHLPNPTPSNHTADVTNQRKVEIKRRTHTWEAIRSDIVKDGEAAEHAAADVNQSSLSVEGRVCPVLVPRSDDANS